VDIDEVGFRLPIQNESNHAVRFRQEKDVLDILLYFHPEIKAEMEKESFQILSLCRRYFFEEKLRMCYHVC
jgi:hypothetical protein